MLVWQLGLEGITTFANEDLAVQYLSVRGISHDEDGNAHFTQVHLAIPHSMLDDMLAAWHRVLSADEPEE